MDINGIMQRLPYYLDAGITVSIVGASGIGKTDAVYQTIEKLEKRDGHEWGRCTQYPIFYNPSDVIGYLGLGEQEIIDEQQRKVLAQVSIFSQPPWMVSDDGRQMNGFKRGVVIFDEDDKAQPDVKKALAPVKLYRRVQRWALHAGIGIVCIANDDSGRHGSTKDFDFEINRKHILRATTSVRGWMEWADKNKVDPLFKAFAEDHVETVFSGKLPEKQGPFCTPRSLVSFSKVAKFMMDPDGRITDKDGFIEGANGAIGGPAARDLVTYFDTREEVPTWAEIVKDPGRAKVSQSAAAQMMSAHICAHNVDAKTCEQAVRYAKRLRPEFHIVFARSATQRDFMLVNHEAFEKWTDDEPQLVALLNALGGVA